MQVLKRFFDIIFSLLAIIFFSIPLILISIILYINYNSNIFFNQVRVGKNLKLFKIYKFKTMTDQVDIHGNLLPDKERLTSLGKFLRSTSLDEIPQFFNVLKGEMSLVGPRPLLEKYIDLYTEEQNMRHLVKPGITGLAQINGRNNISWEKKFEYDVFYVKNKSFYLDIKIIFVTIFNVLKRKDISSENIKSFNPFDRDKI